MQSSSPHQLSVKVLKKMLSDNTHIAYYQRGQWNMIPSLPCESPQKTLSDDTHIVLLPTLTSLG
jgi:hypothetical protein